MTRYISKPGWKTRYLFVTDKLLKRVPTRKTILVILVSDGFVKDFYSLVNMQTFQEHLSTIVYATLIWEGEVGKQSEMWAIGKKKENSRLQILQFKVVSYTDIFWARHAMCSSPTNICWSQQHIPCLLFARVPIKAADFGPREAQRTPAWPFLDYVCTLNTLS